MKAPSQRDQRDVGGVLLRTAGEILITAGVIVALFAAYEVYATNWISHRQQTRVHQELEQRWVKGELALPSGHVAADNGRGLANLYIPRFGPDYDWTIVQGIDTAALNEGPGHYSGSQLPGQPGNFAMAGHRVGKGEPFLNLDKLRAGDPVVVETGRDWYIYCVIGAGPQRDACDPGAAHASVTADFTDPTGTRVPGREVVDPSDGSVVLPVPGNDSVPASGATTPYLTMTTCTPKFSASKRMVVHAVLSRRIAKVRLPNGRYSSMLPAAVRALYPNAGRPVGGRAEGGR